MQAPQRFGLRGGTTRRFGKDGDKLLRSASESVDQHEEFWQPRGVHATHPPTELMSAYVQACCKLHDRLLTLLVEPGSEGLRPGDINPDRTGWSELPHALVDLPTSAAGGTE